MDFNERSAASDVTTMQPTIGPPGARHNGRSYRNSPLFDYEIDVDYLRFRFYSII
jgi:hypothetical protein